LKSGANRKTRKIGAGGAGPGRPKGARGKVSEAARSILGEKGGLVVQKVIDAAIEGDMAAGRALLPFLLPRAERSIQIDLGELSTPKDVIEAYARLAAPLRAGSITDVDLAAVDRVLAGWVRAYETHNLAERLSLIEARLNKGQ
jgi:hypothetical protein